MLHYALGDPLVRALTLASRPFFEQPAGRASAMRRSATPMPILVHARADERAALDELEADLAPFTELERLDADGLAADLPAASGRRRAAASMAYSTGTALRLDGHALLQGYVRQLQPLGARASTGARIAAIQRHDDAWTVTTERGDIFSAPILVNAAGAWADQVAELAGVAPIGLQPKRRTIITFDAPEGTDLDALAVREDGRRRALFRAARRAGCSPRRWTKCRPIRATPSPTNMRWRWPRTGSRSGRS